VEGDDCFLARLGDDADLDLALLNVKDGIRWVALREDFLILAIRFTAGNLEIPLFCGTIVGAEVFNFEQGRSILNTVSMLPSLEQHPWAGRAHLCRGKRQPAGEKSSHQLGKG
jgi:hypothetical protein